MSKKSSKADKASTEAADDNERDPALFDEETPKGGPSEGERMLEELTKTQSALAAARAELEEKTAELDQVREILKTTDEQATQFASERNAARDEAAGVRGELEKCQNAYADDLRRFARYSSVVHQLAPKVDEKAREAIETEEPRERDPDPKAEEKAKEAAERSAQTLAARRLAGC